MRIRGLALALAFAGLSLLVAPAAKAETAMHELKALQQLEADVEAARRERDLRQFELDERVRAGASEDALWAVRVNSQSANAKYSRLRRELDEKDPTRAFLNAIAPFVEDIPPAPTSPSTPATPPTTVETPPATATQSPTPTAAISPPAGPPPAPPGTPTTPPEQVVVIPRPQQPQTPAEPQIASVNPERPVEPPPPDNPPQGTGVTDAQVEAFLALLQDAQSNPPANSQSDVDLFLQAVEQSIQDQMIPSEVRTPPQQPTIANPGLPYDRYQELQQRRQQQATVNPGNATALQTPYGTQPRSTYNPPQHRRFSDPPPTWQRRHYNRTHQPSTQQYWRNNQRFQVRRYTQPQVNLQRSYRTQSTHRTTIKRCRKVGSRVYC
jgi:hypothetical protein